MKHIVNLKNKMMLMLLAAGALFFASCNEKIEDLPSNPPASGLTLGEIINSNSSYSILRLALTRANLINTLSTRGNSLTVFAPDNDAFNNSGLPEAVIAVIPLTTLTPLLQYHIITNRFTGAAIPTALPNVQLPSLLQLPGGNPLVRMNVFPGKNATHVFGNNVYVNNMPVQQVDAVTGSNGVMHRIPFILQPPTTVLAQQIYTDPNHTLLTALIQRADVGQPAGLTRLDSVLKFGVANVTVFAPTNNAVKALINVLSGGAVPLGAPDATFISFINNNIPVANARGVVAYHILGNRTFAVNLPATTSGIATLVGAVPLLTVDRSTSAPRLLGAGNGAGNFSNITSVDRHAVNGVWHVIDRVLLPQ
jgi:uncharacterized surface protein with fasciclin (FAS1) repeats